MVEYIEKVAILSKCEEMWNNADETTQTGVDTINAIDRITDFIEAMPVVDVKHGKWVEHINHRYDYDREQGDILAGISYTCSLCNFHGCNKWHYCPNCGADMRELNE